MKRIELWKGGEEMRIAFFAYRKETKSQGKTVQLSTFCNAWNLALATKQQRKEHFDNG